MNKRYSKHYNPFNKTYKWSKEEQAKILSVLATSPIKVSEVKFFKTDSRAGSFEFQITLDGLSNVEQAAANNWVAGVFSKGGLVDTRYARGYTWNNTPKIFRGYPGELPTFNLDDEHIRNIMIREIVVRPQYRAMTNLKRMIEDARKQYEVKIVGSRKGIAAMMELISNRIVKVNAEAVRVHEEQTIWIKEIDGGKYEFKTTWTNRGWMRHGLEEPTNVAQEPKILSAIETWIAVRMLMLKNGWKIGYPSNLVFDRLAIKLADAYVTIDTPMVSISLTKEDN